MINYLIYLIFFLLSLGQMGRISFLGQQVNGYLYEIPLFILLLILVFSSGIKPLIKAWEKNKSIFIFLLILLFSFLVNTDRFNIRQNIISFLYWLRLVFYSAFFAYSKKISSGVGKGVRIFILLTVIFSIIQYFFYPDLRNLFYLGWDPHYYRLFGLFFDTSVAGAIYGLTFIFLLLKPELISNKYCRRLTMFLFLSFSVMTFSRGLYLSLFLTALFIVFKNKKGQWLALFLLISAAVLFILPKPGGEGVNLLRTFSVETRLESDSNAWQTFKRYPLLGIGYNHIRYEKNPVTENHSGASYPSSFLIILVTGGMFGLLGLMWVIGDLAIANYTAKVALIFISLFSLFDNILLHPFVLFYLLILLVSDG